MGTDLELALQLADAADALSLSRFRTGIAFETKPDLTPVTEADRAVEAEIRSMLADARPEDAVLGEEQGGSGNASRRWIVDPIDGTRNYARGVPVWATLVALEESGTVTLGVVSAPALGRRWWAERGEGAFANGERIGVSSVGGSRTRFSASPRTSAGPGPPRLARARFRRLLGAHARRRGGGRRHDRRDRRQGVGSRAGAGDRRGGRRSVLRLRRRVADRRPRSRHLQRPPARRAAGRGGHGPASVRST